VALGTFLQYCIRHSVGSTVFGAAATVAGLISLGQPSLVLAQPSDSTNIAPAEERQWIVVAARDLHPGVAITEDDIYMVSKPARFRAQGVFESPAHVIGRTSHERILANEFVRSERLADSTTGRGLNVLIPHGMRAVSIPVQDGGVWAGQLEHLSGHVDLLVTGEPVGNADSSGSPTRTLLKAVPVMKAQLYDRPPTASGDSKVDMVQGLQVTLLTSQEDAKRIAHSKGLGGVFHVATRNDLQKDFVSMPGVDIDDIRAVCFHFPQLQRADAASPIVEPTNKPKGRPSGNRRQE